MDTIEPQPLGERQPIFTVVEGHKNVFLQIVAYPDTVVGKIQHDGIWLTLHFHIDTRVVNVFEGVSNAVVDQLH